MAKMRFWCATALMLAFMTGSMTQQVQAVQIVTHISDVTGQPPSHTELAKPVAKKDAAKKTTSLESTQKEAPKNEDGIATPSEMNNLQRNVDVLIGYMIGSQEPTVNNLTQWCKQFGDNVAKSKAVMALANGRQVPENDMRTFGEALGVRAGRFRTSEK